jgi:hypothetical protein
MSCEFKQSKIAEGENSGRVRKDEYTRTGKRRPDRMRSDLLHFHLVDKRLLLYSSSTTPSADTQKRLVLGDLPCNDAGFTARIRLLSDRAR